MLQIVPPKVCNLMTWWWGLLVDSLASGSEKDFVSREWGAERFNTKYIENETERYPVSFFALCPCVWTSAPTYLHTIHVHAQAQAHTRKQQKNSLNIYLHLNLKSGMVAVFSICVGHRNRLLNLTEKSWTPRKQYLTLFCIIYTTYNSNDDNDIIIVAR